MPRKKEEAPLSKHTLHLFEGDFARVKDLTNLDSGFVIRRLVRTFIHKIEKAQTSPDTLKIDMEL